MIRLSDPAAGRVVEIEVVAAPPAEVPATSTWERLRDELVRFVRSRIDDPVVAEDLVHEVLIRALRELESDSPPVHLRGWLYRVARNAVVDHLRTRRRFEEIPGDLVAPAEPDAASVERQLARCLAPLLESVPTPYRETLRLVEIDGLAQREVAERCGMSISGAKSRVQRGRRMLREALLGCCRVELDRRGGVVDFRSGDSCGVCGAAAGDTPARCR